MYIINNMSNNIKLEIELTNKERGDSIINEDIEEALDIRVDKNKTLTSEEVEEINKCLKEEKCANILPYISLIICSILGIGVVMLLGYGLINLLKNFVLN